MTDTPSPAPQAPQEAVQAVRAVDGPGNAATGLAGAVRAPSSFRIEQAMSVALATVARIYADGEIVDDAALLAEIAKDGADVETLLTRLVRAALEAKAYAEAAEERAAQLYVRRTRFERQEEAWRGAAFAIMDALDMKQHKGADFTASISAGKPGVTITDEAAIPEQFFRTTHQLDKAAVNAAVKDGQVVPGAELTNGFPQLTIRSK